jgi:hypothetical protein
MRIRPFGGTLIAARQSRMSPTVTFVALRSRNMSERSERCHDCSATCFAIASTEFDKTIASRKPRCSATRRVRSSKEMPHSPVSASGESATINNGGREAFVMLAVKRVFASLHQAGTRVARTLGDTSPEHFTKKFWRSEHSIVASRRYERECWFTLLLHRAHFGERNESRPYFSMINDAYNAEIAYARDRIREIPDKRIGSTHSRQTNSPESGSSPSQ